jgi:KipI family sensor histidine kinase inhibitor
MGPTAALVECAAGEAGRVATAAAAAGVTVGHHGVVEVVPAASTVLVECTDPASLERSVAIVRGVEPPPTGGSGAGSVELAVRFDGADLEAVAHQCRRPVDAVIESIVAATLTVEFCGFAPGFAYLGGLESWLHLPRRDQPRPRVPEGSFAIAAGYAAVYPTASPGGWHLLGSTDAEVWSTDRDPPALLGPGTAVRIVRA